MQMTIKGNVKMNNYFSKKLIMLKMGLLGNVSSY